MHIDFFTRHAPAEIVLLILQFCDSTTDVLALVSSCRTLYNVWLNDSIATAALWTVWLRRIPHFRLAILAVSGHDSSDESSPLFSSPTPLFLKEEKKKREREK